MNTPGNLSPDEQPVINYNKSKFTWLVVGAAGFTIIPYLLFVINFSKRALNPNLFLEHLGRETQHTMTGTDDVLTYVLMLFMGLSVCGILVALIGTVILLVQYSSTAGFTAIRAGCGTALCCQGILIICAFTIWIAKALALFNGEVVDPELGVRIVYTPERLSLMSNLVFLNGGMIWGVWVIILPVFLMIYFAEKDFKRRQPDHI